MNKYLQKARFLEKRSRSHMKQAKNLQKQGKYKHAAHQAQMSKDCQIRADDLRIKGELHNQKGAI